MRVLFASLIGSTVSFGLPATGESLPMNAETWDVSDTSAAAFERIADRDALCIQGGAALVKDMETRDGIVSVDIFNTGTPHFGYLVFRALDGENSEEFYLRMHKSRQLDALQYNPHMNDEPNWQLFGFAQAAADFGSADWVTLQVEFAGDKAKATAISEVGEAVLEVNDLAFDDSGTRVGLRALQRACFSNFQFSDGAPGLSEIADPVYVDDPNAINSWKLSPQSRFDAFADQVHSSDDWIRAQTEPNGTLLISRYVPKTSAGSFRLNEMDVVYAGAAIYSDEARTIELNFDVSDIGRVYLNGNPKVELNNTIRAKGTALFRGDFAVSAQSVFLDLEPGKNELIIGVAERTNGWGLSARIVDMTGLSIQ